MSAAATLEPASAVGVHDLLFVTLDTLRFDVAAAELATGRTPTLERVLPGGRWEERHTPGSFTFAAHAAFFAGFWPTPVGAGPHERWLALEFAGSESTGPDTVVLDAPNVVTGLADLGYHTICVGGTGFFDPATPLGTVLSAPFAEVHWSPELGVTDPASTANQVDRVESSLDALAAAEADRLAFTFVNVSALHQPNRHFLPGAVDDSIESHAAALRYVDGELARLFRAVTRRRPCGVVICADHGTLYGEDGHVGHRVGHPAVWTVPYAGFVLPEGWT